jgi:hypothetical protein
MSILAALFILIGAAIWTSIIQKCEGINTHYVSSGVLSGIIVSYGSGIYLVWAAFACLAASIVPYMVRYDSIVRLIRLKRHGSSLNQLLHIPMSI